MLGVKKKEKGSSRSLGLVLVGAGGVWLLMWSVTGGPAFAGRVLGELVAIGHLLALAIPTMAAVGLGLSVTWRVMVPHQATQVLTRILHLEEHRPRLRRIRKRRAVWRLAWKMPVGATVADLRDKLDALQEALDCSARCWYDRGLLWVELGTNRVPELVDFARFCGRSRLEAERLALPVPLGESKVGPLWADLEALPHMLIGGTTGAGKSVLLRQAVTALVMRYGPERLRLVLVDMKGGMEFNVFRDLPHLLYPVVTELEDCEIALGLIGEEMGRRQAKFASAGVENLSAWNAAHAGEELPWLVAVVDEFGELRAADAPRQSPERGRRDAVHALISRAGRIGRAVGVHLVVCTQRPDADTVTPQLRAQLPATVALHCVTDTNSRVLLDNSAAADLAPRPGRAIWQWEGQVEVQLPMLEKAEARGLLAERYPMSVEGEVLAADAGAEGRADAA